MQRSPFQALLADVVPSRYRSMATGSVTFQMCAGAIVFLMLGRMLGMRIAFLVAAGTVLAIAAAFALGLREGVARGVLAGLFLLCTALGGALGDPLNGSLFDLAGGYRPLFLMMAAYTALAFVAVLLIPRGAGEADTGEAA